MNILGITLALVLPVTDEVTMVPLAEQPVIVEQLVVDTHVEKDAPGEQIILQSVTVCVVVQALLDVVLSID